jgi:hypothetical protein
MVRPVFADPKTDFVFQRIFGSEDHKPVLGLDKTKAGNGNGEWSTDHHR